MSIADARAALLKIWPKGRDCEHVHAREAFAALDEAEAHIAQALPMVRRLERAAEQRREIEQGKQ